MAKIAFLFSGQGAQYSGMGKSLYENSPAAKELLDRFEVLRPGLLDLCFSGTKEDLALTMNTQPAVYAIDLAAAAAITEKGVIPYCTAGFSLGELAALAFSGVYTAQEGFLLVQKRAELMTEAAEKNPGSMLAVLKMESAKVEELCSENGCYPVNYNCPGQLVVAGSESGIEKLQNKIKETGGRSIKLAVSGGFHSPFMDEAAEGFSSILEGIAFQSPTIPVYSNFTGELYKENVAELLTEQINHPVRWEKIVREMHKVGAEHFIELGPGKVLSGLLSKIFPDAPVSNVQASEDL